MNAKEFYVLSLLLNSPYVSQRNLSSRTNFSLGTINNILKKLLQNGYIDKNMNLTNASKDDLKKIKPKNAVILSAGIGLRIVPIHFETPKALAEIKGEILIERLIRQLQEAGVKDIYVVVGFMKEKFEYLIEKFKVKLIVNTEYFKKSNLHSLKLSSEILDNSYIINCNLYFNKNPFNLYEPYSWCMVNESKNSEDTENNVYVNKKNKIFIDYKKQSNSEILGLCYLSKKDCDFVKNNISKLSKVFGNEYLPWQNALFNKNEMLPQAKKINNCDFFKINTYNDIINIDNNSNSLENDSINLIKKIFNIEKEDIYDIKVLKKGMTNRSFIFTVKKEKYILRIPGKGTDFLINRKEEKETYDIINGKNICDDVIYINEKNGYKISKYFENSRCCDKDSEDDLKLCMKKLKEFHNLKLKVNHEFDIFEKINFYQSLWKEKKSIYKDYDITKKNIESLKPFIDSMVKEKYLTHMDANCDNFLFLGKKDIKLIDWEYASMQDPHVDIAMFCIYAMYDKKQIDKIIDIYFENNCDILNRIKIYSYIACCGLLWSNWCEYKLQLGIEFGEYSIKQYSYAKKFYIIVKEMLKNINYNF